MKKIMFMMKKIFLMLVVVSVMAAVPLTGLAAPKSTEPLDPENLPDGEYSVPVTMFNYSTFNPDDSDHQLSMADGAMVKTIRLRVENGQYYVSVYFHSMAIPLGGKKMNGYLKSLEYWQNGRYRPVTVDSQYDVYDDYNDTNFDNIPEYKYPRHMTFPLANKAQGDEDGCVRMRVFVPIMEAISPGSGSQDALMAIDWKHLTTGYGAAEAADKAYDRNHPIKINGHTRKKPQKPKNPKQPKKPRNGNGRNHNPQGKRPQQRLHINSLKDGVYAIKGNMVKTDKRTYSMANDAITHTIKLTVENGQYFLTMNFFGLDINGQQGYLGRLQYFTSGYSINGKGVPQGNLAQGTILAYQTNGGSKIKDKFGTNYPKKVRIPMIPEAKKDGYVPLKVFVPVMESITPGTGDQTVYLQLNLRSLQKATSSTDFDRRDSNGSGSAPGSSPSGTNGLKGSTLPTTKGKGLTAAKKGAVAASSNADSGFTPEEAAVSPEEKVPPLRGKAVPTAAGLGAFITAIVLFVKRKLLFGALVS